jgi:hypothetical protein
LFREAIVASSASPQALTPRPNERTVSGNSSSSNPHSVVWSGEGAIAEVKSQRQGRGSHWGSGSGRRSLGSGEVGSEDGSGKAAADKNELSISKSRLSVAFEWGCRRFFILIAISHQNRAKNFERPSLGDSRLAR